MSTNAYVGVVNPDGSIAYIYCHWDGDRLGDVLQEHYQDEAKVRALIALGDCSSVGERVAPDPDEPHTFHRPANGVTVAYARDRGEPMQAAQVVPKAVMPRGFAALFGHLPGDHRIYLYTPEKGWESL